MSAQTRIDTRPALAVLQQHVGCCREWVGNDRCGEPAEFVLWGKLIAAEALGPRCYDHAAKHIGHRALASRSGYALIRLADLAYDVSAASLTSERPTDGASA